MGLLIIRRLHDGRMVGWRSALVLILFIITGRASGCYRARMAYSKYSAKPTIVDGIRFASKAESRRFAELRALERAGIISGLTLQPKFPLEVNGAKVCTYIGDFAYIEDAKYVVEDVKGVKTDTYKIKRKLLLALQPGLDHREVGVRYKAAKPDRSAEIKQVFRDAQRGET